MKNILFLLTFLFSTSVFAQETIEFPSEDGLIITADLYIKSGEDKPMIILFHQAGWSRGEYLEIAPKLNDIGYNCIAIDQRSGGGVNDVLNKTNELAKTKKLPTTYVDALQDMNASIDYVKVNYPDSKVIIWGSSYSSALSLKIAGERKDLTAVLAFAPGEYFTKFDKPKDYVLQSAKNIVIPTFITSAKEEKQNWWNIYEAIPTDNKTYFLPESEGQHGSRALWEKFEEHEEYWKAVKDFLNQVNED